MSAMKQNRFPLPIANSRFFGLILVLLGLMTLTARAAQPEYENDAEVQDPSPIPDATNFYNTGAFIITFPPNGLYQTHDTLNYTNTGYMGGEFGFFFDNFSTASGLDSEAASFDNENTIENGDQCIVWATNIVCPGWINLDNVETSVGPGGLLVSGDESLAQFTGNYVDLDELTLELSGGLATGQANANSIDVGTGTDTKGDWQPSVVLTANTAQSSLFTSTLFPLFSGQLFLAPSLSYFSFVSNGTNDFINRVAFVQNDNPATPYNVYFGSVSGVGLGNGFITVGWSGVYTNFATGQLLTNYLYLNDVPEELLTNGEKVVNGIPNNYTFTGSSVQLITTIAPTVTSYSDIFNTGIVTDNYSYVEAQMISTSVATNSLVNTNVAAIGGRVLINASQELSMNVAQINGENYVGLTCTNQFDGTGGAAMAAPYADIDIGVTNGNLVVSNVIACAVPVWSGTIQAFTTDWLHTFTNSTITISNNIPVSTNSFSATNDYRVELVHSDISPTSPSQIQNLTLLGTNSVVISDNLNVFGSLYINAQSLTITTNGIGNGAESEYGTLNVENNNIFWPTALPNVHWLTNNGAISFGNLAQFGTLAPSFVTNVTPAIVAVSATNTLFGSLATTNGLSTNTVTVGSFTYSFVNRLTNATPNQIAIAPTFGGTMSNLIAAINGAVGAGTAYSTATVSNAFVTAGVLTNNAFIVTAITNGTAADSIAAATVSTNLFWTALTLLGGTNAVPATTNVVSVSGPYGAFVNSGTVSDTGSIIYANYFLNGGPFNNAFGNFTLFSINTILTNGDIFAYYPFPPTFTNGLNGTISITADTLIASNVELAAGGSLSFQVTNLFTDTGVSNGNVWFSDGGSSLTGLNLPIKPVAGDLLGTTINVIAPQPNKTVKNTWAGQDLGVSTSGYTNNEAIGQLILTVPTSTSGFRFNAVPGTTNAIYVDRLVLNNYASLANVNSTDAIPTIGFNNVTIYYADAQASASVTGGALQEASYELNHANGNHFRWVPQYTGFFSSTNMAYPNGSTNTLNIGLVLSPFLDSNGNGSPNSQDSEPVFVPSQWNVRFSLTNNPTTLGVLTWDSIPSATNVVYYSTNMMLPMQDWTVWTNFQSLSQVPPVGGWPITNLITVPLHGAPHGFYHVRVYPNSVDEYGN